MSERNKVMTPNHLAIGLSALTALEQRVASRVYSELNADAPFTSLTHPDGKNLFGLPFEVQRRDKETQTLKEASGFAMSGHRVAMLTDRDDAGFLSVLKEHETPTPLVIYWINDRISTHTIAAIDVPHLSCSNEKDLLPMALLAHKIAETALCPVILSIPARSLAWVPGNFHFPADEVISSYLGAPGKMIKPSTKVQAKLFGDSRPAVPNWMDLNLSMATGLKQKNRLSYYASASRQLLSKSSLSSLMMNMWDDLNKALGCSFAAVESYAMEQATCTILTEGSSWNPAQTVVDSLNESSNRKVGALNLRQLYPFPKDKIEALMGNISQQAAFGFPLCHAPLPGGKSWHRFLSPSPSAENLFSGISFMLENPEKTGLFWLDASLPSHSDYPKRQVLLSRIKKEFPELEHAIISRDSVPVFKPGNALTIAFTGFTFKESEMTDITRLLPGPYLNSWLEHSPKGFLQFKITGSEVEHRLSGNHFKANKFFSALNASSNTFYDELDQGGEVFFSSPVSVEEFTKALSPKWKKTVSERNLKVYLFKDSGGKLIEAIPQILQGHLDHDLLEEITDQVVSLPLAEEELRVPAFIQSTQYAESINNIPRFYGETIQPQEMEPTCFNTPEPALTMNVAPALTGLFSRHNQGPDFLPEVFFQSEDPIGLPWLFCPEGAIGAVSIAFEALFGFAASRGEAYLTTGKEVAGKLKRSFKHLASRIQTETMKKGLSSLDRKLLDESFQWLLKKIKVAEHDVPAYEDAYKCMCDSLFKLPIHLDPRFFADQESAKKGTGQALCTFVNPDRCNGCGLCADASCEEGFKMMSYSRDRADSYRELWEAFEEMPDTSGETIERMTGTLGHAGAIALSKYTNNSVVGSGLTDPGSGLRLATKMIISSCESVFQRHALRRVQDLDSKIQAARENIRKTVSESIPVHDAKALEKSLQQTKGTRIAVADLLEQLSREGQKGAVDAENLKGLASLVQELESYRDLIMTGNNGLGQARYNLLITSTTLKDQIPFPINPFQAPVCMTDPQSVLAAAEGTIQSYLRDVSRLNQIDSAIQSGPKTLHDTQIPSWDELSSEQQAMCPPILVLCGRNELIHTGMMQQVLSSPYPIKLILLDEYRATDLNCSFAPALTALLLDHTYVASCALHESDHLGQCLNDAFNYSGPAFIHLYTPHPRLEGNAPSETLKRSLEAVDCMVHPLFHTLTDDPGIFGTRLHLLRSDEKPDNGTSPGHWALGHGDLSRFFTPVEQTEGLQDLQSWMKTPDSAKGVYLTGADRKDYRIERKMLRFTSDCITTKKKLMEIAGVSSPFTSRIQAQIESELAKSFDLQAAELERKQKQAIEEVRAEEKALISEKVTDQLLRLTGYMGAKK